MFCYLSLTSICLVSPVSHLQKCAFYEVISTSVQVVLCGNHSEIQSTYWCFMAGINGTYEETCNTLSQVHTV